MSGIEIKRLRQEGKLDEALNMAKEELNNAPTDGWAKRNLAWVYDNYCKKYAEEGNIQAFDESVCALIELGIDESESMLINSMGWRFRSILSFVETVEDKDEQVRVIDRLFELVRQFNFTKPSETYSVLFKAFLKYKDIWPSFKSFCEWWNFDNFRQEDYVCEVFTTGRKESCCLVERAFIAYSKCLLQEKPKDADTIKLFISKIESLAEQYPNMDYPGYYTGKLMLAMNEKVDDIVSTIRPFIQKKKNDFWAWQLLAEAVEKDNRDLYLACLLRAIKCKTKDEFLVRIRMRLVAELANRHLYNQAAQQLIKYEKTKLANNSNWQPSGEERFFFEQSWYRQYKSSKSDPVNFDYMKLTNEFLYGDVPEQRCIVSFVNNEKKMVTVVYGYKKEGFFKYDSSLCPQIGMSLSVRVQQISQDGYMKIISASPLEEKLMDLDFYKELEGLVIYNTQKEIFSFKADNLVCYIPSQVIEKNSLKKDQTIKAKVLYAFNKKKEKWMWRIIEVGN